jgi:DNA invertase Pin-like site-specific DNA recombinase
MEVVGPFDDEDVSGAASLDKRLGMLAAIAEVRKGDVVLVAKRDRLGRDPIVNAMIESAIARKGGRLVSVLGEGTEGDDPAHVLMRRMIDAFSEYERLVIKARTRAALRAKIKRRERVGAIRFGFDLASDGKTLVPNVEEQATLARIVELKEQGMGFREIARLLNAEGTPSKEGKRWFHTTVAYLIRSRSAA